MTDRYLISGLTLESDLLLPELVTGNTASAVDVVVHLGDVPTELENAVEIGVLYQAAQGRFLLQMPGIARYLVLDGREIIVQPEPDADAGEVRLFLLGSVWAALLHQRGLLTLHASAIQTPAGAVVFAGRSSYGKSALAAAFYLRGYPFLADDTLALAMQDGAPVVYPTYPQAKLWPDVAYALGLPDERLLPLRPKLLKRALPTPDSYPATPQPLRAIYILHTHQEDEYKLEPVLGMGRFSVLLNFTFRERFLNGMGTRPQHFQQATGVARQTAIAHLTRPDGEITFDPLIELIEKDLASGQ